MPGFWDKLRGFFGGDGGDLRSRVKREVLGRAGRGEIFTAEQVAAEVCRQDRGGSPAELVPAAILVGTLWDQGYLRPFNYSQVPQPQGRMTMYVPLLAPATPYPPASQASQAPAPAPRVVQPAAPPKVVSKNAYAANPEILALSADEMRKRALRINPYQTAWIGRTDTIPPQSDERTALIDRGLVLTGRLTEAQLAEIHTVGDLWLRHHESDRMAASVAGKTAEEAVKQLREEREKKKAQKKAEAAARKEAEAKAVAERRANDIVYLGRGVSWGLHDRRSNVERLQQLGLPLMSTPKDVAAALKISVKQLRWLAYHSEAVAKPHYVRFEVKKRSGGMRALAAPMPKLAVAQEWILRNVLDKLPTEPTAHGFIRGRSTVTNAREHLGRDLVVNLDLKDFFPTVSIWRVRGVFQRMGYSPAVAAVLGLLCTEPPRREVELFGQKLHVSAGDRALPQGACTSPSISNQVARRLDRRLKARAGKLGWAYTRYADDLTFSAPPGKREELGRLHAMVRHTLEEEGFALNLKKGRVQAAANQQTVTGIVVNRKPGVPREEVRRLRAILHQAKKTGLKAQNRENHPHFEAWLRGKLAYLFMVDPAKGGPMLKALDALAGQK
ncbi:MAG TPA: reverse transcriptase family protein [Myxococcaceae bacterium]|nr:reverse transcriptase family protein [Myxococcaceae bacterium]